jgi:hypothetical protein
VPPLPPLITDTAGRAWVTERPFLLLNAIQENISDLQPEFWAQGKNTVLLLNLNCEVLENYYYEK